MIVQLIMRSEIMDAVTCSTCMELDGITLPADSPEWAGELGMLAHCNCRYDLVPIFEVLDIAQWITPTAEIPRLKDLLGKTLTVAQIEAMRIPTRGMHRFKAHPITAEDIEDLIEPADLLIALFGIE